MKNFIKKLAYWDGNQCLAKIANAQNDKVVQLQQNLNVLYPETFIQEDGVMGSKTIEMLDKFMDESELKKFKNNFYNPILWQEVAKAADKKQEKEIAHVKQVIMGEPPAKIELPHSNQQSSSPSEKSSIPEAQQKINWISKFKQDILCNLSDIEMIRSISQTRINQIESQNIENNLKDKMIDDVRDIVYRAVAKVVKLEQDLKSAQNNPNKIRAIREELVGDITSGNYPEDIKNKMIEEMVKVINKKIIELIPSTGMAAQTIQGDLRNLFPNVTENLFKL